MMMKPAMDLPGVRPASPRPVIGNEARRAYRRLPVVSALQE